MTYTLNDPDQVREADQLDSVLGELLDVQHDLAEITTWLAETWPADLRPPRRVGTLLDADATAVRLTVYLCAGADLYRAAAAMGVPVLVEREPNTLGHRYARATRRFGLVELEAYSAADLLDQKEPAP